jgi:glycosyltransferase involved in cell wall biosynthesis
MAISILSIIPDVCQGGAFRAAVAAAKYSSRLGSYVHKITQAKPGPGDLSAAARARGEGVGIVEYDSWSQLFALASQFDIVQLVWWNSPAMNALLHQFLPPMRLIVWIHVGAQAAPQIVTKELVQLADFVVPGSPFTAEAAAIRGLSPEQRVSKCAMAYSAADFARLDGFAPKPHQNFNVGYIGLTHFIKMHRDYIKMSAAIDLPDVRFIVCGNGGHEDVLKREAEESGVKERFIFKGFVDDIRPIIEELDVYGYPLCEDNYSASELNLQEIMYAGLPVVVFPYGGVSRLVINDFTGLVVNSAIEYKQAIEFLYHHPEERRRLGQNAREYAKQIFGAEICAHKLNDVYARLMQQPKRERKWQSDLFLGEIGSGRSAPNTGRGQTAFVGAEMFIESLGDAGGDFHTSLFSDDMDKVLQAEARISGCSEVLFLNGVGAYLQYYNKDGFLQLWYGLIAFQRGDLGGAAQHFLSALQGGCNHWRNYWYLALVAAKLGDKNSASSLVLSVLEAAPGFGAAKDLLRELQK